MRIIGGKYRHKHIEVPKTFKARPTTDFAKESLFNILSNVYVDFDEAPSALDLFSGTGSISLELLSRGCRRVVSVEKDYHHFQFIQRTSFALKDTAWQPYMSDVFKYLDRCHDRFDIIFADPPYQLENIGDIPALVLEKDILAEGGIFIMEHGKKQDFSHDPRLIDHRTYGSVNFSFFRK